MVVHAKEGLPTVFIAVHPRCPCTRATVANLERAFSGPAQHRNVVALIYTPQNAASGWAATDTVERIAALGGVRVVTDINGRTAGMLGMKTSGQVLCYDRNGSLAFAGGVTPSRGHEGDCPGLAVLCNVLAGNSPGHVKSSVPLTEAYGCPLCNDPALAVCGVQPGGPK